MSELGQSVRIEDELPTKASRVTLDTIAQEAGVSRATVDRVLNGRAKVHPRTRDKILEVRQLLMSASSSNSAKVSDSTGLCIDVVIPHSSGGFMQSLSWHLKSQAMLRGDLQLLVHRFNPDDPVDLARSLNALPRDTRALAVLGYDNPLVREALNKLARGGTKVCTLVTDIQGVSKIGYIGIDNRSSGRLAGHLLSQLLRAEKQYTLVVRGPVAYRGQEEREMGFRHFASDRGDIEVVAVIESPPHKMDLQDQLVNALNTFPHVNALYNMSSGNGIVGHILKDRSAVRKLCFVGHDLTENSKALLLEGAMDFVIDQNPRVQARDAIDQLLRSLQHKPWNALMPRTQIICAENIPQEI